MFRAMPSREFLGWDRPFLHDLVEWLAARPARLPQSVVVVPTAQAGRRLREALAESSGALLSPQVVTPGSFFHAGRLHSAPDWMERLAWVETLDGIRDWSSYQALFPHPPENGPESVHALSSELFRLRRSLQENGLTFATSSARLRNTMEAGRWEALARLETLMENLLTSWGFTSGSRSLASGISLPERDIILAGVADLPPLLERALLAKPGGVTVLIAAPETESGCFSETGLPLPDWCSRPVDFQGEILVVADPRQQAAEAWRAVACAGTSSDHVALGSADADTAEELARTFTGNGWTAFHPAAAGFSGGLSRWLAIWSRWLADPTLDAMADLLTLPETGSLIGGRRAQKAKQLAEMRDRWMATGIADLTRRFEAHEFRSGFEKESSEAVLDAARSLERWRARCFGDFPDAMKRLLAQIAGDGAAEATGWLEEAAGMIRRIDRSPGFWIDLMISEIPPAAAPPPEGRVIDVQGWLELLHEPGAHLVLCGMNEGKVPARGGGEPWLGESSRKILGLITDEQRAARDAYLFHALLEARRKSGKTNIFCGKSGPGGEPLLPSRLLLTVKSDELPNRVKTLFREVEPPDAGLRWHADWKWKTRAVPPPQRLGVTSLSDYLACPFRYYLKHVVRMQGSGAARREWNARDFGSVAHEILERWGNDAEAREFGKAEALEAWFSAELDRVVAEWFGNSPALAVRLQTMALRRRLSWLARVQATEREAGWQVIEVERKVEIPAGDSLIVAKIDRVDRNLHDGRLRVIDYKTGKIDGVEKNHRKKITARTSIPVHLHESPAIHDASGGAGHLWHNLQLPLYASAVASREGTLPVPCYFSIRSTENEVAIHQWESFDEHDMAAARACADYIAEKISAGEFWPPAERVTYDDYQCLTFGRTLEESVTIQGAWASRPHPCSSGRDAHAL